MGCSSSQDVTPNAAMRKKPPVQLSESWKKVGAETLVKLSNRGKMVKEFCAKLSADDKTMLCNLFNAMSLAVLKHDGFDQSKKALASGDCTVDQAFKLAAYIMTGTLTETVKDQTGADVQINMDGPLQFFVADAQKHKDAIGGAALLAEEEKCHKLLCELKGEYSTISPVEIVKAIGKDIALNPTS